MASPQIQNPPSESKSSKKKKARTESTVNGAVAVPDVSNTKPDSSHDQDAGSTEHPYIKELQKHIRNAHKKLSGMQKTDAVIAENLNVSLDDLVAQRKINNDQKASILKKPQIQQQLAQYEEQIAQYRKFDEGYQTQLRTQREEMTGQHEKEVERLKEELREEGKASGTSELRKKLLILSSFLRLAAAKRMEPVEADTDEGKAFEGALLGVYGGDDKAVDVLMKLIEGSEDFVPNVEGSQTSIKFSQIKQASIDHVPYHAEESWVDSVAEAQASGGAEPETDPTIAHAGLTEINQTNGVAHPADQEPITSAPKNAGAGDEAGNAAGDSWDTKVPGETQASDESFEMIPRPQDEVETANPSALPADVQLQERAGNSWADEPAGQDVPGVGLPAETSDAKSVEELADSAAVTEPPQPLSASGWAETPDVAPGAQTEEGDGFSQVPGRRGGRGGRGRGADGEFRGRGRGRGGFRGDGEFRGRGRGGFRGQRGDGEFRGRGGRGRGRGGPPGADGPPRGGLAVV